jgi:hypothetical protein
MFLNNTTVRLTKDLNIEFLPIYDTQKISIINKLDQNFNVNQFLDLTVFILKLDLNK